MADAYWVVPTIMTAIPVATGLLANDSHPDNVTFTAVLDGSVEHSSLTLFSDGSFTYQSHADYVGPDQFAYRLDDGSLQSTSIDVDLHVASSPVVISEFMAANELTLPTRTRTTSGRPFVGPEVYLD